MPLTLLYPDALSSAPEDAPTGWPVGEPRLGPAASRFTSPAEATRRIASVAPLLARSGPPLGVSPQTSDSQVLPLESGLELWIRRVFKLHTNAGVGACAALPHGARPGGLIVRPVHLHAARDHLVLWPPEALALGEQDAAALCDAACAWLRDEPIRLRQLSATLWELSETDPGATGFQGLLAASSSRARGRNIDLWLPKGPPARAWRRLMNEVQMLWHSHPINEHRASLGQHPVNALWLEGNVPLEAHRAFDVIASENPLLIGLAALSGATLMTAAEALARCKASPESHSLIDLGAPASPESDREPSEGSPLTSSLGQARMRAALAEIVLTGENGAQCFRWRPSARWKLWRTQPRADWLYDPPVHLN